MNATHETSEQLVDRLNAHWRKRNNPRRMAIGAQADAINTSWQVWEISGDKDLCDLCAKLSKSGAVDEGVAFELRPAGSDEELRSLKIGQTIRVVHEPEKKGRTNACCYTGTARVEWVGDAWREIYNDETGRTRKATVPVALASFTRDDNQTMPEDTPILDPATGKAM